MQSRLSFTEVYHAVTQWLSHIEATPDSLTEPADGIVEMRASGLVARIKYTNGKVKQGAVLSLLRTEADGQADRLLFAVTRYSDGAIALANSHVVALYIVGPDGAIHPKTAEAHALMPRRPVAPPFQQETASKPNDSELPPPVWTPDKTEWLTCPNCGSLHHPYATNCVQCRKPLHEDDTAQTQADTAEENKRRWSADRVAEFARPVPAADPGKQHLQCRTCGSTDIDLVDPEN